MEADLTQLLEEVTSVLVEHSGEPPWPSPRPADGQSHAAWAATVRRRRDLHDALALEGYRLFGRGTQEPPRLASVTDHEITVGADVVAVRVYRPAADGPLPAVVFLHGGSFWMAGGAARLELTDAQCRHLAHRVPAVVVSLDYRLAPEHRYPAPLDDAGATLDWLRAHADELGVDPERLGLLGASSGGHVVAGLALRLRDRGEPVPRALMLRVPLTQSPEGVLDTAGPQDPTLEQAVALVGAMYLPEDLDREAERPYLSPVDAPDLRGLPPTHIVVAELDPLTAASTRFAQRLGEAGVPCTLSRFPMMHSMSTPAVADAVIADLCDHARELLAGPGVRS